MNANKKEYIQQIKACAKVVSRNYMSATRKGETA